MVEAITISVDVMGPSACAMLFLVLRPLFCSKDVMTIVVVEIVSGLDALP
jgi:hypothetical protein